MVTISCSGKLHAFDLAEQLERNGELDMLLTTYAYQKNYFFRFFTKRKDKEKIKANKIGTNIPLAFLIKLWPDQVHIWNNYFDLWVSQHLAKSKSRMFVGWSGMSLHSIRKAKKKSIVTILERGSTHIEFQNEILKAEYAKFGINFSVHQAVIKKELLEYMEADYISVPSYFVKKTFTDKGIPEEKIFVNPYGASKFFSTKSKEFNKKNKKFTIVYLGTLSIRKGLIYLFEALQLLQIPLDRFEMWFIGSVEPALRPTIEKYRKDNWKFLGHVNHYDLEKYLVQCDIGIQPSLEEGLSTVIPQLMACGVPLIATPNTGGENIIVNGKNGIIVGIRDPQAIAKNIQNLYQNPGRLADLKKAATDSIQNGFTWDDYGTRYINFLKNLRKKNTGIRTNE